ncbi:MAG: hypothetical protein CVU56_09265 [Deltaproteobacteria bacterium HGW-Deltaproteobacteria-14]|nr:MAG: hypothetical protein CVU56_09265 [Deltaproteobacteria bacterium HGW-Deltaproteobacteria-14]
MHPLSSLQVLAKPAQAPTASQTSLSVHGSKSLQVFPAAMALLQVQVVRSQTSAVHGLPSAQSASTEHGQVDVS